MLGHLPAWVYDVVIDLQAHDEHPKLLFESGAAEGPQPYDWCPCATLDLIPEEVRVQASAINAYMQQKVAELPAVDPVAEVTDDRGAQG